MICVTICTRQRPKMLKRALDSCVNVTVKSGVALKFLVVENGPAEKASKIVEEYQQVLDILYRHEPREGLVYARNAAIEGFLESGAIWMGSMDDDGALNREWLSAYLKALGDYPECRAFAGPDPQLELENATRWLHRRTPANRAYGEMTWSVSTANLLFHRDIFVESGLGMRFDKTFNYSGGEDIHFFTRLKDQAEIIRWVPDAITLEKVSPERGTFPLRVRRAIQGSQNYGVINLMRRGKILGGVANIMVSVLGAVNFVVYGLIGAVALLFNRTYGEKMISKAVRNGCRSIGRFKANFAALDTLYINSDGE